ncbi:MAG TPA: sigma-70 family RNA polymerase sigma factor [Bryobacteraceae bacterium]|nr:sigma-70 family RNA polymerase sigma factor [Bryobacteraceae bacterium]
MNREEILARLRERIVAFAASRMSGDVAEDLAQEVMMVLHDRYPEVDQLEELLPLSQQILRFKMAGLRRKVYRRGEKGQISLDEIQLPDGAPNPEAQAQREETLRRLTRAVEKLPFRCRELMRLKLLGRSFAEIQEELEAASINTVYTWDARCRKQLLDLMGGRWEAE